MKKVSVTDLKFSYNEFCPWLPTKGNSCRDIATHKDSKSKPCTHPHPNPHPRAIQQRDYIRHRVVPTSISRRGAKSNSPVVRNHGEAEPGSTLTVAHCEICYRAIFSVFFIGEVEFT